MVDPDHIDPQDVDPMKMIKGIAIYLVLAVVLWMLLQL